VRPTSVGGLPGLTTPEGTPLSVREILPTSGTESSLPTVGIGSVAGLTAQLPLGVSLLVAVGPAVGEVVEHPAIVNATIAIRSTSLAIFTSPPECAFVTTSSALASSTATGSVSGSIVRSCDRAIVRLSLWLCLYGG
jgi:hypothetical protein